MTFAERLEEYRNGLQWRDDFNDFIDSLDGRGGICARDAAEDYADELADERLVAALTEEVKPDPFWKNRKRAA